MRELPGGTVTFLFTDVEGSTRLLHELGEERYAEELAEHRRLLREAFAAHGGVEVDTQGDAFFFAFRTAPGALAGALAGTDALYAERIRVRVGLHTGTPVVTEEGYVGGDVHRAARIAAAGHGGQVLVSAATAALVDRALTDLGEHRLKDLSAPERIYQAGEGEFPPLKTLYRTNLPVPATRFLGRERELEELRGLLDRDDARLVTLTGPGGTGKTRLALQAAAEVAERFPDGVFWTPLASLRDPELVLESAATAVGAKDGLAEHLGDKRLLVVLDNFEHLVDAAAGVAALLASCPHLRFLVTSRELLRVQAEVEYEVPPLAGPEAVELFCARSRLAPDDAIAELCRRLDNLPLAVELAAARARMLSPRQITERLSQRLDVLKGGRDADARQQTLRATIEWSHDLLSAEEQRLCRRLAVFAGGCTLEAAEEVADADLDVLQALVDKSLVRRTGERFWMLETIREYAAERLEASREDLRKRHAEHFARLAEAAEEDFERLLDRLTADYDNVRAALTWSCSGGDPILALRLTGALWRFWWNRGSPREPTAWLDAALSSPDAPEHLRVKALYGAANMAILRGDFAVAVELLVQSLAFYRRVGDPVGTARSLNDLGIAHEGSGDFAGARPFFEEAAAVALAAGDSRRAAAARANLAGIAIDAGALDEAEELCREALAEWAKLDSHDNAAAILSWLGLIELRRGRLDRAAGLLRECLAEAEQVDSGRLIVHASAIAAAVVLARGDPAGAAQLLAGCATVCENEAVVLDYLERIAQEDTLAAVRTRLEEAELEQAWAAGAKTAEALGQQLLECLD